MITYSITNYRTDNTKQYQEQKAEKRKIWTWSDVKREVEGFWHFGNGEGAVAV